MKTLTQAFLVGAVLTLPTPCPGAEPAVTFTPQEDCLQVTVGGKPFAAYVFRDEQVRRPYFAHLHSPNGARVTRNHPPVAGQDATDHATMHPGLWLAFGDLGGADFWRNKGLVKHVELIEPPQGGPGQGRFTVRNRYEAGERVVCEETGRYSILVRASGYLLLWDSLFKGNDDFAFGDQEEMGLGVRVATPLSVKKGGRIVNSDGLRNEKQVWGKPADWCEYGGEAGGQRLGVILMPDPRNFRRSWFHARDYGLLVANPFGRNAFTKGEKSQVVVKKGEEFRLRFGVFVYAGTVEPATVYQDYLDLAGVKGRRP